MADSFVKFTRCNQNAYDIWKKSNEIDADTIYFVTHSPTGAKIYLGDVLVATVGLNIIQGDNSILVSPIDDTKSSISVKLSKDNNGLSLAEDGLKVTQPNIVHIEGSSPIVDTYELNVSDKPLGERINVPKIRTVNNIVPDDKGNISIDNVTTEQLLLAFEALGILTIAKSDDDTTYTDNDGNPYLLRQSNLFNVVNSVNDKTPDNKGRVFIDVGVKTVNNSVPDKNGNIDICKPFIGVGEEVEIVEGPLVFEFTKNTAFKSRYFEIDEEGKKYIVTFNGETYECISKRHVSADHIVYTIGNMSISDNGGEDTGEPFYYGFKQTIDGSAGSYGFVRVREHGKYVMSIIGTDVELVKIPENLIPEIVSPALKNVGKYIDIDGATFSAEFTKNTAFKKRYLQIDDEGEIYKVLFNNVLYTCVSRKVVYDNYIAYILGNDDISDKGGQDTGEPFYYCFKKYTDGINSDYGLIRVREHGNYTVSIVKSTFVKISENLLPKIPENLLPKIEVGVKTVNNETPDENGNIDIKTGGSGSVKSVNNRYSDEKGNIDVCAELADVGNNVFVPTKPTYAYYVDTETDNGAPQPDFTMFSEGDQSIVYLHVEDEVYESPVGSIYVSGYIDTTTNTLYKGFGNYNIINSNAPDNGDSYVCCTYKTYSGQVHNSEVIDSGVKVLFRDGIERSYCIKIGQYRTNKIPESLLPNSFGKSFVGVKTINNRYPDANYNVNICQALANVGYNVFVPTRPTYAYYADCDCDNGVEMLNPRSISYDEFIRIMFDGHVYEFEGSERDEYIHAKYPDYENVYGYGNFSIIGADDGDEDAPDNGIPFVYYYGSFGAVHFEWVGNYTEKHSFSIEIGKYQDNKIPKYLLDDSIVEAAENSVKTVNDQTPDGTGNIDVCKALMNVGDVLEDEEVVIPRCFVQGSDTTVGYYCMHSTVGNSGEDPRFPEITDEFVYRIIFDGQIYDFNSDDIHSYDFGMDDYADYFGNPSLMPEPDDEEMGGSPGADNGMPFVYYVRTRAGGSATTVTACVVVKDEEKHTFKLSVGKPTVNKIPEELLPESVIVIDCPEFNGQKSIPCETLGGYTIAEMQEFINNGGIVKIKRTDGWTGVSSIDTYYYEATSFVPVVNYDQSAIVFTASTVVPSGIIVTDEYSDNGELEVRCSDTFATDPSHQILVWAYNTLIDGYNGDSDNSIIEVDSWAAVQQIVRSGKASEMFNVGDQLICRRNGEQLVWDIIGIDHDTPVDETKTHSLTLQLHSCFNDMTFSFDEAEPTNPDAERASKGSNNWIESNIRQWLNSDKSANNWFEPQTEYDTAPQYANIDGFLCGMDADFVAVLGEVTKSTQLSNDLDGGIADSVEKVFLLSMTEVYCGGTEGVAYEYYASASSVGQPNEGADDARIKHYSNGDAADWWLRSANQYTSGKIRPVGTVGNITWTDAYLNRLGVIPACCII